MLSDSLFITRHVTTKKRRHRTDEDIKTAGKCPDSCERSRFLSSKTIIPVALKPNSRIYEVIADGADG